MGILQSVFSVTLPEQGPRRYLILLGEGASYTAIGFTLVHLLGLPQAGVLGIFLVAASLTDRTRYLLDENRDNIWVHGKGSWSSNTLTTFSVLALFLGIFAASAVAAVLLGSTEAPRFLGFIAQEAALGGESITERQFGAFAPLLGHNALVLLTVFVLAFIYRAYGALLALAWNAVVWAFVLTLLVMRAVDGTVGVTTALLSGVAVMPHLICEGLAYILGALTAIFLSRGLAKYSVRDPHLRPVLGACLKILVASLAALVLAAAAEAWLTPALMGLM